MHLTPGVWHCTARQVNLVDIKAKNEITNKSAKKRLLPPLVFVLAFSFLGLFCYESGYSGLPPTEKRYTQAKAGIESLKLDEKKASQREPWEKLAREFNSIYNDDPAWPNRPAALFRAAESLEELAGRSFSKSDAKKAISAYETLALRHAESRLADDALFRAAKMRAAWLKDDKGALALITRLKRQYPNGDMVLPADNLEKALLASARGRTAPEALKASAKKEIQEDQPAQKTANRSSRGLSQKFQAANSRMNALKKDAVKSRWRQPWETLRDEYLLIHKEAGGDLSCQALFRAASCQEALALCSWLPKDRKAAVNLYLSVPQKFARHDLADDALLAAARLEAANADKSREILDRLLAQYPKGDKAASARKLRSQMDASKETDTKDAPAEKPELQVLSWDSKNKNKVEIILELSAPVQYKTTLLPVKPGSPSTIAVSLPNASVVKDVQRGVKVSGSLLKAVRVQKVGTGSNLHFDFRSVRKFNARAENDPCRIILEVEAGKAAAPAKTARGGTVAGKEPGAPARLVNARQVSNMASQLGLTVHRVFIDAGHGGRDPGTSHNNILERKVVLDVALDLGRLLRANGLEVVFSRTTDKTVSLSDRTRQANRANADLFISIHINAHENPAVSGFETYYLDLAKNAQAARVAALENATSDRRLGDMNRMLADVMLSARADESNRLATDIQRLAMFRLKKRNFSARNNGVKSAPFHVLLGAQMPAVLVEIGYCTNGQEAKNLANAAYRHAIAEGLAEGVLAYKDRLLKMRTAENLLTPGKADAM